MAPLALAFNNHYTITAHSYAAIFSDQISFGDKVHMWTISAFHLFNWGLINA